MPTILDPHSRPSRLGVQKIKKNQWGLIEGSLNSKLPTIWRVEMQMRQAVKSEGRRCTSAKVRREKIHPRQMLERLRNAVFFQWFVCGVSRKVGLLKRRVRRRCSAAKSNCTPLWRKALWKWKCTKHHMVGALFEVVMSKNCTLLWRKAHYEVKMLKNEGLGTLFEVLMSKLWRKAHYEVKMLKNWSLGTLFEVLMSKNCTQLWRKGYFQVQMYKTPHDGAFFEVLMSKNCTRLWREAHLEVKMLKNWGSGSTFWGSDVEKLHPAVAKSTLSSQNVQNTSVSEHFVKFWCRKIARSCGEKHIIKSKCTKHISSGQFFQVPMSKN